MPVIGISQTLVLAWFGVLLVLVGVCSLVGMVVEPVGFIGGVVAIFAGAWAVWELRE